MKNFKFPKIFGRNRDWIKARVHLRTGVVLEVRIPKSWTFCEKDFSPGYFYKLKSSKGKRAYLTAGDRIDFIEALE